METHFVPVEDRPFPGGRQPDLEPPLWVRDREVRVIEYPQYPTHPRMYSARYDGGHPVR
jgi:hypothetical protein